MQITTRAVWMLVVATGLQTASAQAPTTSRAPCYPAGPGCSAFFLTNGGGYVVLTRPERLYDTRYGAAADWDLMFSVSDRDAVGFGVLATISAGGTAIGPQVTYRRWLGPRASLDVGLATPLGGIVEPRSLYGTIRWSPVQWFGVTARPELLRVGQYHCGPTTCLKEVRSHGRFSLGVDAGGVPGLVASASGGLFVVLMMVALAGID